MSKSLPDIAQALRRHFDEVVLPAWRTRGFNPALGLPHEALGPDGKPLPDVRYRAMACARQLYVHARAVGAEAAAHADALFAALLRHFRDERHGGWRYSVDPDGKPLDTTQDLYTHAFVIFACAAYFERSRRTEARQVVLATAQWVEERFHRGGGVYDAALSEDGAQRLRGPAQNPVMHLTEAYLAAARVIEPTWFAEALRRVAAGTADQFLDPATQCVLELPQGSSGNRIEPGHQFEWYVLLQSAPEVFDGLELPLALPRGCAWIESAGVAPDTGGVAAAVGGNGAVHDPAQRIWAQTEYLRYLALTASPRLAAQLGQLQRRFLHAGGWHECLDPQGAVVRADMPATTPYHLATCYETLASAHGSHA
ncbi:AGE family epimerase/isomerase [Bordetella sp. 2513F-2]